MGSWGGEASSVSRSCARTPELVQGEDRGERQDDEGDGESGNSADSPPSARMAPRRHDADDRHERADYHAPRAVVSPNANRSGKDLWASGPLTRIHGGPWRDIRIKVAEDGA